MSFGGIVGANAPNSGYLAGEQQFSFQNRSTQQQFPVNGESQHSSELAEYLSTNMQGQQSLAAQTTQITNELDEEMRRVRLQTEARQINDALISYGYVRLGNLFDVSSDSVEQTVYAIRCLLQQRQKDLEFRSLHHETLKRDQHDIAQMYSTIERLQAKNKSLQAESDVQSQKVKNNEREFREERERLSAQVRELSLSYQKIVNRETQFNNEFRKKDSLIKQYQDQIKKYHATEKTQTFVNSFEITSRLDKTGPAAFSSVSSMTTTPTPADIEFTQLIAREAQDTNVRALAENQILRESLAMLHTEMSEMITLRADIYARRMRLENIDGNSESSFASDLNLFLPFKKELFAMPMDPIGSEAIDVLVENLRRFKEAMNRIDNVQRENDPNFDGSGTDMDKDIEKIACLKNLKGLLKNYKYVIETQDTLINKAIVKSKNLDHVSETAYSVSRFNKILDDQEIENAKLYLVEQRRFLEDKQNEMEKTKSMMSQTVNKLSEAKNTMKARRQELERDAASFKENIASISGINGMNNGSAMIDEQYEMINSHSASKSSGGGLYSSAPNTFRPNVQALQQADQNLLFSAEFKRDN